jgi:hypothetical protein
MGFPSFLSFQLGMVLVCFAGSPHIVRAAPRLHLKFLESARIATGDSFCTCDHDPLAAVGVFAPPDAVNDARSSHFENYLNWIECSSARLSELGDYRLVL